ncbi:Spy/CpxP family protein refolding chaperone [Acetobacter vaccinii]|uniref:Periplasmic heavy metal sensor n=1 Tax=Acetobacter vaccinii TaxID=2592655 RepID=A0A5C1YLL4_9PROT|nr:Spy/CpxP family protein refolding chaperone [Acetobacter vaccinii]QEO16873.1 periplasmic heavy metal sensor [Acetobacter vaccinii]
MKKSFLATTLMAGLAAASISLAHAADSAAPPPPPPPCGPMHHGHGPGGPGGPVLRLDGVKLTTEQKAKLKQIFTAARPENPKADMEQMHALHHQLREALTTPGPVDQAKLQDLERQISALQAQNALKRLQVEVQVHDILTKEQLKQIADRPEAPPPPPPPPPPAEAGH